MLDHVKMQNYHEGVEPKVDFLPVVFVKFPFESRSLARTFNFNRTNKQTICVRHNFVVEIPFKIILLTVVLFPFSVM